MFVVICHGSQRKLIQLLNSFIQVNFIFLMHLREVHNPILLPHGKKSEKMHATLQAMKWIWIALCGWKQTPGSVDNLSMEFKCHGLSRTGLTGLEHWETTYQWFIFHLSPVQALWENWKGEMNCTFYTWWKSLDTYAIPMTHGIQFQTANVLMNKTICLGWLIFTCEVIF